MVSVTWASTRRRAAGKLRPGGKRRPVRGGSGGGFQYRVAPDQAHQRQMALQAGPTPALIIAQPQLLLPILMEAFDGPAAMRQPRLVGQGTAVQSPGAVPFRVARLAGEGLFRQQPAHGPG